MVGYPLYWEVFGQIPPQGGPQDDRETTLEIEGHSEGIPPAGGHDGGGGTAGGRDLRLPLTEHGFTVYCEHAHYEPVSGEGAEAVAKGFQAVMDTGRDGCEGDVDYGSGGRKDKGRGGYVRDRDKDRLSWGSIIYKT